MDNNNIPNLIKVWYERTGKVTPTQEQACEWAVTELGEVFEQLLAKNDPGWVRNNPNNKEPYSPERFAEECADVILMLMVACLHVNQNPLVLLELSLIVQINKSA